MDLTLSLTHACNMSCSYCFAGEKDDRVMSWELGREALVRAVERAASGDDGLQVSFFGGEPLLEWSLLLRLVDEARRLAGEARLPLQLQLTTNGLLLTESRARALAERGVRLAISLDGLPAAQDATRRDLGGGSTARRVWRAVETALRHAPARLTVILVVDPAQVALLPASVAALIELGVEALVLNPNWSAPWDEAALERWARAYREVAQAWLAAYRAGRPVRINVLDNPIQLRVAGSAPPHACRSSAWAVAPSGRVYSCARRVGEDHPAPEFGLARGRLGTLSALEAPRPASEPPLPLECQACALRERCSSRCACANAEAGGDPDQPAALVCWHERLSIPLADEVAARLYQEGNPAFLARFYADTGEAFTPLPEEEDLHAPA